MTEGRPVELRVRNERPVLVGTDGTGNREVDPDTLPLGGELAGALREWAKVAAAVDRGDADAAADLVSRRGAQLAARVADALGRPVEYADPVTGEVVVVEPSPPPTAAERPAEPTPWSTGLTVAAFVLVVTVIAVVSLASTLHETNPLLALVSNVVISAGLLPSIWLARRVAVWRWVAAGVAGGIVLSWLALPFILFG
ncbi:DUF2537 domain-containing protein [Actinokineospora spheciospongiae]|uniref:DUF2537 domain-containing protein n=1 Tax=Actinokineospora spheciospongiae TaxID=909613 RepID=UPI0026A86677